MTASASDFYKKSSLSELSSSSILFLLLFAITIKIKRAETTNAVNGDLSKAENKIPLRITTIKPIIAAIFCFFIKQYAIGIIPHRIPTKNPNKTLPKGVILYALTSFKFKIQTEIIKKIDIFSVKYILTQYLKKVNMFMTNNARKIDKNI